MKRLLIKACMLVAFTSLAALPEGIVSAATISGQVVMDAQEGASNVVVYLEGVKGTFQPPFKRPKMDHIKLAFQPPVLAILKGTLVNFPNSDPVFHSAFSLSPSNPFELGIYSTGPGKTVQFSNLGEVEVFCHIHSYMHAFILVRDNPYFTVTDSKGRYTLSDVPRGNYVIKAWHGFRQAKETKKITIDGTQKVTLNFDLHPKRVAGNP